MLLYNTTLTMEMKFLLLYCHMVMLREFQVLTVEHRRVHLSKMKKTAGKPKYVISKVFDEAGGMLGASSSSEIPRNRRQIYNIQHSSVSHGNIGTSGKPDPVFELLQQCKMDLMPGGRKFIRSVNFETSSSCVIATDAQLQNVVRFCTNQGPHCILGIDPTFNLGKFYVTVTTFVYTHVVKKGTMEVPTFLNQARAGRRPARVWFLEITLVRTSVCVFVCVCVCPPPRP